MKLEEFLKIAVVASDAQAERADMVVCALATTPAHFTDDVITDCARGCGQKVRHRPHAPKRPPKVCMPCAIAEMDAKAGRVH